MAFVFCSASNAAGAIVIFLMVLSMVASSSTGSCFVTRINPVVASAFVVLLYHQVDVRNRTDL